MCKKVLPAVFATLLWPHLVSGQSVTFSLVSPQDGTTIAPGQTVDWSLEVSVSDGDNLGLAFFSADIVQDAANPSSFDLPPAVEVPLLMSNFSRPAGFCNPGESGAPTGYIGLQRGSPGQRDLAQIGGAQNTLGVALSPGTGTGEIADPALGIGQSGPVVVAAGAFLAPATEGTYTIQIQNLVAGVLTSVVPTPGQSDVAPVVPSSAHDTLSFDVTPCESCDANCDGIGDGRDIEAFVEAVLMGPGSACSVCAGDLNNSGGTNTADVIGFVNCLLGE